MDIPRDPRPAKRKRAILAASGVAALLVLTLGVQMLPQAVPTVSEATLWPYTVEQGTLVRQIRGSGTLVPEDARLVTAVTNGRVEEVLLLPGSEVQPGDVILRLSNPDVDMNLMNAEYQLSQAVSALAQLRANIAMQELSQEGSRATQQTQYLEARRVYEANQALFDENPAFVAQDELERSRERMEELRTRVELDEEFVQVQQEANADQIGAREGEVARLREMVEFSRSRQASLEVTANASGVLAPVDQTLQVGQWVSSGQQLARVVVPGRLKAEVRISQNQAQEVMVGQTVLVDTRTDTIQGQVARIDPAVRGGTVTIDVRLPADLPSSARPDLTVDGYVVLDRLPDVVIVGRPSYGQANQRVTLFKLVEEGDYAERVTVEFGAASVSEIEVKSGLDPGDVVILSDMSDWDGFDRVRIR